MIGADLLIGLAIVLSALAMRIPYLWSIPTFTDESREVLLAIQVMRGEDLGLVNVDAYIGGFWNWLLAACFWLFGLSPYTPRLVTAVAASLTVGATILLARETSSRIGATIAATLLTVSSSQILSNAHLAWSHCLTPLFTTLGAFALTRSVRRDSQHWLLAAGALFGLAFQTHPATLLLLPGAAIYVVLKQPAWLRSRCPYLAMLLFLAVNLNTITHNVRTGGDSLWDALVVEERYNRDRLPYWRNLLSQALMIFRYLGGAVEQRQVSYLLDPVLWLYAAAAVTGLAVLARRGFALPALLCASSVLIMPYFNERKYVPVSDGRYLMPLLPLAFVGIGSLADTIRMRGQAIVGPVLLTVALTWPLWSFQAYVGQEQAAGRTNAPLISTLDAVSAARSADEPVLLDSDLRDVKYEGGGTAFRSLRYLLSASGIADRSADNVADTAHKLPAGTTALLIQDRTAYGRLAGEAASTRPFGVDGLALQSLRAPADDRDFGIWRLRMPGTPSRTAAAAAPRVIGPVTPEVVATGFRNPRGLAYRSDGSLIVAEAGNGGPRMVDVGREKPQSAGKSGSITRLSPGGDKSLMAQQMPSIVTAVGEEVGPTAVAYIGEQLYVLTASGGWDIGDSEFESGIFKVQAGGKLERVFNFSRFTYDNPTRSRLEDPRADVPAGMPYGMAALNGRLYVTDGNQEQVIEVNPADGSARRIAEYPRSNRALTGIAAGPDGALYVAEFSASKVTRITPTGEITDAATRLRLPIGVTFDNEGQMYVLEYGGRVLRAAPVGQEQRDVLAEGIREATAIVYGPDGNLYVSAMGHRGGGGEGRILRIRLVPTKPPTVMHHVLTATPWVAGLVILGVLFWFGYRFRDRSPRGTDATR
ncbi:MAG: ScyD/ScyE family protein [Chloroflexota bacterium]